MGERSHRYQKGAVLLCAVACVCCACGRGAAEPVTIEREPYERATYKTVEVQRGDLTPKLELTLTAEGYERIDYDASNGSLELDKLYVSVGDKVKEGELLVSFKSESVLKTIEDYSTQAEQNRLLVEHYTKLMQIDKDLDYSRDIQMLKQDIELAELYVEEAKEKLEGYQIRAKKGGTITAVDEYLQKGMFMPGKRLITQVCGSGNYSVARPSDYEFAVGDKYQATDGVVSYELKVKKVTEREVVYQPLSDTSGLTEEDSLTMTLEKPVLKDAVYVDTAAVKEGRDGFFVYVVDEDGFRSAVPVEKGDRVDDYFVITEGLSGGEKVAVN